MRKLILAAATVGLLLPGVTAAHAAPLMFHHACTEALPLHVACHALVVDQTGVHPHTPSGFGPADLASAYALPGGTTGLGETVAIVDAYDDPSAESDLAVYRSTYGLPACSSASGCFRKIDQHGGTSYPAGNVGWAQEISLDLDMVSAICPYCAIVLVESDDNSFANITAAVNMAATQGVIAISNSYGAGEFGGETAFDSAYNHPGIAVTASSGDAGYGVEYPAASPYVTAVGGTSLTHTFVGPRGWSETAWSGAGSGCSTVETKPSWQTDTGCAKRTVADVSAVADPSTGVAVYDTYGSPGWMVFGGTSVSAPIIASVYALAGSSGGPINAGSSPWVHPGFLFDVTSGSNGSCGGSYLCTAGTGYDGPTGLGTPNGTGAFVGGGAALAPTTLTATPAIAYVNTAGGTAVYALTVNATLKVASSGAPLSGRSITFRAGSSLLCTATTNGAGTASCSVTVGEVNIVENLGYTATFAGDFSYLGASATAPLAVVQGIPVP